VREAILDGNREEIVARVDAALAAGTPADRLVDDRLIPAIVEVGDRYDRKTYFLPQLIAAAEAMKAALARLEPLLRRERTARAHRGTVLMATVAGDIHDIGKNIVVLMLRNHGFDVVDLGKDVTAEAIVAAAQEHRPEVIGLSALMTTTMVRMKDVIARAADAGLTARFMVGGAVVTAGFAASIGAAYARDGVEAVRVATALVGEVRADRPVM
jgi:5-methyltetrahydrofolate--homocysteine methyltransferase